MKSAQANGCRAAGLNPVSSAHSQPLLQRPQQGTVSDSGRIYGAQLILAGSDVVFLEMQGSIHGFTTLRKALPSAQKDMQRIFAAMRLMLGKI